MTTLTDISSLLSRNALDEFDAAVAGLPDGSVREFLLGLRADRAHDVSTAIRHYERAMQFPDINDEVAAQAPVRLTYCHQAAGDVDGAIIFGEKHLLRMQTLSPFPFNDEIELRSILANCYSMRGEFLRAIALTAEKPASSFGDILIGQWGWSRSVILFQAGYVQEALDCGLETVERIDRSLHPHFVTGIETNNDWMRCVLGQPLSDQQLRDARGRVEFLEQSSSGRSAAEMRLVLAFALAVRGEYDEARAIVQMLQETLSQNGARFVRMATVLAAIGDQAESEALYRRALDLLDPDINGVLVAAVWRKLAAIYENNGDLSASLESMNAAFEAAGVAGFGDSEPLCLTF